MAHKRKTPLQTFWNMETPRNLRVFVLLVCSILKYSEGRIDGQEGCMKELCCSLGEEDW